MFGFPINSKSNDIQKFTNNADSGFTKPGIREVFYSIKDGVWNDTTVWQTASGRVGLLPTANDDVYVRHTINTSTGTGINTFFCNNLFNTGRINVIVIGGGPSFLTVFGNINCIGILDMSLSNCSHTLILCGADNKISNLLTGTGASRITYARLGDQPILDIPYNGLIIGNLVNGVNIGKKYPTNNIVCNFIGIQDSSILDLSYYNLTCNSTTLQSNIGTNAVSAGTLLAAGSYITFKGPAGITNADLIFDQNVTIEFQNGVLPNSMQIPRYRISNCTYKFTTNNQSIFFASGATFYAENVIIDSNITLTCNSGVNFYINTSVNGTNSLSKLTNAGNIYFNTQTAAETAMTVGVFDITTSANTVNYAGNYSATIPSAFTTFSSLTISGTGTKTLGANTTLNGNLLVSSGTFQLSTFNLTVTGTSTTSGATGFISKNSTGDILFIGAVSLGNGSGAGGFNFSGNPNVEFRNGITTNNNGVMVMGSGNYTFTTNNQTIFLFPGGTYVYPNATIVGAITVTWTGGSTNVNNGAISGFSTNPIGTVAGSKLVNNGSIFFNGLPSGVMSVGVFDITTYVNNVTYNYNGDDTLPFTTYSTLAIGGSGTKTLNGNTTINGAFAIYGNSAVFECSTHNLTVNGTFGGQSSGTVISKTGSGSLLFVGAVSTNTINWVLTGNPTIECRGGFRLININTGIHNLGNGAITFSTNNQTLNANNALTFNNPITISGAITLTVEGFAAAGNFTFTGVINGNNASSTLRVGTTSPTINYQSATQPMAIGVLNTSTNLNTWIYGNLNQDIKGSPTISPKQVYRNLTLNGLGIKTLQGYVSVLNTYTLTAPATLLNNGFTLTNP